MVTTAAKSKSSTPATAKVDWEAVERDFRATQMTLRELAAKHGCSHVAIANKGKRMGWSRDLGPAVRKATTAALIHEAISKEVNAAEQGVNTTVRAMAEVNKQVILGHRKDITKLRNLAAGLMNELADTALTTDEQGELASLLAARADGEKPTLAQQQRAQALVRKSMNITGRIASVKALAETFTRLQLMERTAFGLDDNEKPVVQPGGELSGMALMELKKLRERLSHE
jgi:hypothetical protein